MNTTLVSELRDWADHESPKRRMQLTEAISEIERLRVALSEIKRRANARGESDIYRIANTALSGDSPPAPVEPVLSNQRTNALLELSWQTYLGNRGPQSREARDAFIAAWCAGWSAPRESAPETKTQRCGWFGEGRGQCLLKDGHKGRHTCEEDGRLLDVALTGLAAVREAERRQESAQETTKDEGEWVIVYADQDRLPEHFSGAGANAAARGRFDQLKDAWTCRLFRCVDKTGYGPVVKASTDCTACGGKPEFPNIPCSACGRYPNGSYHG